jgi:Fe-S-cluster containining protein
MKILSKSLQYLTRAVFFFFGMLIMKFEQLEFKLLHLFIKPEYERKGGCKQTGMCCEQLGVGVPPSFLKREWLTRYLIWWHSFRYNFEYLEQYENAIIYRCRYLTEDKKCGIYKLRPRLCREYPKTLLWGYMKVYKGCGFRFVKRGAKEFSEVLDQQMTKNRGEKEHGRDY